LVWKHGAGLRQAVCMPVGQPMLAHKAVHDAHVAAEVIAGGLQGNKELAAAAFNARVIPSVAYTEVDPEFGTGV
jgi:dihydrolipoamide dehydrogenase